MMTPDEVRLVDQWMFDHKVRRGRSEAIRQLIELGLAATPPAPARPKKSRPPT